MMFYMWRTQYQRGRLEKNYLVNVLNKRKKGKALTKQVKFATQKGQWNKCPNREKEHIYLQAKLRLHVMGKAIGKNSNKSKANLLPLCFRIFEICMCPSHDPISCKRSGPCYALMSSNPNQISDLFCIYEMMLLNFYCLKCHTSECHQENTSL